MANKLETRTGCEARIRFAFQNDNGMWKVSHFVYEHNHELAMPEERQFLRSNRKVSEAHLGVIKTMMDAGIRTTNTYSYLSEEVGGSQNVGFTKRDCYNVVNKEKMVMIEAGDAQSLINLFKRKQAEDPMFFYTVQVDQENQMTNFFWRDGRSRIDYDCFGDVVVFDTTYRTNRYNMICAPFVGVNHHWKNVLFGCAFLLDEKTDSFIWLFETFLESMGGRKPKTIFTDQCQAMANGIEKVFPGYVIVYARGIYLKMLQEIWEVIMGILSLTICSTSVFKDIVKQNWNFSLLGMTYWQNSTLQATSG
ncbi:protein FAR1-RELATED SEQUENCE 5-like [Prunus dulcis]|uniref:protein FAR1-RELATED SEQUENCE 5-like n=1 Tax=Prunus dulcis TaxID=3755 RepID=UPI0014832FF0|nr:protein FAR1-RELATED SEQUENCE 5-like [Prunus dulcis]XP_034198105.1 protein FAR1-RELATED SEQUENCE 5-like [Prunus dulcis]